MSTQTPDGVSHNAAACTEVLPSSPRWFPDAGGERDEQHGLHGNPDHAGYLTVGSDVEMEDAEPKGQRGVRPTAHESQPNDDEDADPGSSDEERASPPSRFSSGN